MLHYAHKEGRRYRLLSVHLARVAAGAAARLRPLPHRRELIPAAILVGLTHDFGKYTTYFQHYLRQGSGGALKQHAFISGLWAVHLASRLELPASLQMAVFLSVIRHHQGMVAPDEFLVPERNLILPAETLDPTIGGRFQVVQDQVADLRNQAGAVARSLFFSARRAASCVERQGITVPDWLELNWSQILQEFLDQWTTAYGKLYGQWRKLKRRAEKDLKNYFTLLSLFSALIDADKIHAAGLEEGKRAAFPAEGEMVERYRAVRFSTPRTPMEILRENLYRNVTARVKKASHGQRIFTITAPTGSGKTLAGMHAAFCLRSRLAIGNGPVPRIIYALPFTSIIDQTFNVGKEVLQTGLALPDDFIPTSLLLKHHHLAEIHYQAAGGESMSLDEALMLIESWQSEIVITTFVQLFHTLIGYENRMLKKFCRLGGAILILDEVQNIPVEYWPLVEETLRQACEQLDMRVILMTATRPEWFSKYEALELAGDPETVRQQFRAVNRVAVITDITPLTVDSAVVDFLRCYCSDCSYLVVLNTIKSSIDFYEGLREEWSRKRPPLYYLSTNIVPAEREQRLGEIRTRLERGEKLVLVSTQVVEAGVDLDFDEVWRDIGPVDSVVQVAGRCNRHFKQSQGKVRLMHLVDREGESSQSLASFVYGKIHTLAARRLFAAWNYLEEPDFFDAVGDYFSTVRRMKSMSKSEGLLEAMVKLRFSRWAASEDSPAVKDFALIRNLPHYIQVFVCTDAVAEDIWNRYQTTVAGERDLKRRREAFLILKRDFLRYLVSVPADLLLHRVDSELQPPVIHSCLIDEFYDAETGFKRVKDEGALIY